MRQEGIEPKGEQGQEESELTPTMLKKNSDIALGQMTQPLKTLLQKQFQLLD